MPRHRANHSATVGVASSVQPLGQTKQLWYTAADRFLVFGLFCFLIPSDVWSATHFRCFCCFFALFLGFKFEPVAFLSCQDFPATPPSS